VSQDIGQKISEVGQHITVSGEKIKVGILDKEEGNARIFKEDGCLIIKGIFGLVQWFRRGDLLEKVAYNTVASSVEAAKKEMEEWIPKLQYPEYRENSVLLEIIEHDEKSLVTEETKYRG